MNFERDEIRESLKMTREHAQLRRTRTTLMIGTLGMAFGFIPGGSPLHAQPAVTPTVTMHGPDVRLDMELSAGRYGFSGKDGTIVSPDKTAGILLDGQPVSFRVDGPCTDIVCVLAGRNASGDRMGLTIRLSKNQAELIATPLGGPHEVRFMTGGAAPGFGLADLTVTGRGSNEGFDTDISGFKRKRSNDRPIGRQSSNFTIYPKQRFAQILVDPKFSVVESSAVQIVQGASKTAAPVSQFYFFGDPHQIYARYLAVRNTTGHRVLTPKYRAFGVGWEAFGALGYNTKQTAVSENIAEYLKRGYPLRWAVIGSGFWPNAPELSATTSFGMWNGEKYPDPLGLIDDLRKKDLDVLLGLRINFLVDGPFSKEGVAKGYFINEDGNPKVFSSSSFPKTPFHLLDTKNPDAVNWYVNLTRRWQAFGIRGFKEDLMLWSGTGDSWVFPSDGGQDRVDPVNEKLMNEGIMIIQMNSYLASNGDLHRINDFNYNQNQDRGPVNTLAFAYSGLPLTYPDVVGGTFANDDYMEDKFAQTRTSRMNIYMIRNAWWAALHAGMSVGVPPWSFSEETAEIVLRAARFHDQISPYIYSNAVRFSHDGYPWTMTPLPIAFPDDPNVYGRENSKQRGYQWMIGDALMATPLYGNDYDAATTRDVYLPAGKWMDFDTGKIYAGNQFLRDFRLPPGKTPLFVGGSGVTLENRDGKLVVCVYPVARSGTLELTLPNGKSFRLHLDERSTGSSWTQLHVRTGAGRQVAAIKSGHAFVFEPSEGTDYWLKMSGS